MKNKLNAVKTRWQMFCGLLMAVALGITLLGSLPFFRPNATNGSMGGLGDGLFFGVWLFGVFGLIVFFIENATGKKLFAILGVGWSILGLAWGLLVYSYPYNQLCLHDTTNNGWLLAASLAVLVSLFAYEKTKEKIPPFGKFLIKAFARSMVVVWTCALLFAVATFNRPLPLRIDRTAHPITQQSGN